MRTAIDVLRLTAVLAAMCAGCASSRAPDGFIPDPEDLEVHPLGAWLELQFGNYWKDDNRDIEGEFIGVRNDSVFVLPDSGGAVGLALDGKVDFAGLRVRTTSASVLAAWTTIGMLSTISHGYYLLLSVPTWAVAGYGTVAATANDGYLSCEPLTAHCLNTLTPYARFPAGIPPGLNIGALRLPGPLSRSPELPRKP